MSLRAILVLMVLFLVLGFFAVFEPLRSQQQALEKRDREGHVLWLKGKTLERIRLRGKNGAVELQCALPAGCPFSNGGEWRVSAPFQDAGDPSAIGALASSFFNLPATERLDFEGAAIDPKEFGLDQPRAEIELFVKGESAPYSLRFGKDSDVGPSTYLSSSHDPRRLFLVPNYSSKMLDEEAYHWRNKRFFQSWDPQQVTRFSWKSGGKTVRVRQEEGRWRLAEPVQGRAADLVIAGLVSTAVYAEGKSVFGPAISPAARKILAGRPELEIELARQEGEPERLSLFALPPVPGRSAELRELLAAVAGREQVYRVEAAHFERFHRELKEYRERSLLGTKARAEASTLRLSFPREKKNVELKLEKGLWAFSAGDRPEGALSQERLNGFLSALQENAVVSFPDRKGADGRLFASQRPDLELRVEGGGHPLLEAVFLVHDRKSALAGSEGELKELGEPFLKALPVRLRDITEEGNKQVVALPPGEDRRNGDRHRR